MKRSILLLLVVACLALAGCATEEVTTYDDCVNAGYPIMESYPEQCSDGENTFTNPLRKIVVGPQLKDCVGVGPQKCMVVDGNYFYDSITGFDFTPGYTYTLVVNVTARENVPADANKFSYTLVEIQSKEETRLACTREYEPVCGEVQVQCITTPCDPIQTTFSNSCEAQNSHAIIVSQGACEIGEPNYEGACLSFDGNWLEDAKECEGMGKNQCEVLGGTFNECASACRNNPDAQFCTLQCVQVCRFS